MHMTTSISLNGIDLAYHFYGLRFSSLLSCRHRCLRIRQYSNLLHHKLNLHYIHVTSMNCLLAKFIAISPTFLTFSYNRSQWDLSVNNIVVPSIYIYIVAQSSRLLYIYTCLTSIPRFALREKVTPRLLKLLF